jgi:hypothetical protein
MVKDFKIYPYSIAMANTEVVVQNLAGDQKSLTLTAGKSVLDLKRWIFRSKLVECEIYRIRVAFIRSSDEKTIILDNNVEKFPIDGINNGDTLYVTVGGPDFGGLMWTFSQDASTDRDITQDMCLSANGSYIYALRHKGQVVYRERSYYGFLDVIRVADAVYEKSIPLGISAYYSICSSVLFPNIVYVSYIYGIIRVDIETKKTNVIYEMEEYTAITCGAFDTNTELLYMGFNSKKIKILQISENNIELLNIESDKELPRYCLDIELHNDKLYVLSNLNVLVFTNDLYHIGTTELPYSKKLSISRDNELFVLGAKLNSYSRSTYDYNRIDVFNINNDAAFTKTRSFMISNPGLSEKYVEDNDTYDAFCITNSNALFISYASSANANCIKIYEGNPHGIQGGRRYNRKRYNGKRYKGKTYRNKRGNMKKRHTKRRR